MVKHARTAKKDQVLTLAQRQAFMTLSLKERRRMLATQADAWSRTTSRSQSGASAKHGRGATLSALRLPPPGGERSGSSILTLPSARRSEKHV